MKNQPVASVEIIVCGYAPEFYRGRFIRQISSKELNFHWPFDKTERAPWILRNIFRIYRIISFAFRFRKSAILYIPAEENFNVYYAIAAKILFKLPLVSELYLSLYMSSSDWGLFNGYRGAINRFLSYYADYLIVRYSDVVLPLTMYEFEQVCRHMGFSRKGRVVPLPLAVDCREPRKEIKKTGDVYTVCYWGAFVPLHGLDKVIYAFESPLLSNCMLVIYGPLSDNYDELRAIVAARGLEKRIEFRCGEPYKSRAWEKQVMAECDLAIGIFGNSPKTDMVVPNKVIDSLSMCIPILTKDTAAIRAEFGSTGLVYRCSNSPIAIAEAIKEISNKNIEEVWNGCTAGLARYMGKNHPSRYKENLMAIFLSLRRNSP